MRPTSLALGSLICCLVLVTAACAGGESGTGTTSADVTSGTTAGSEGETGDTTGSGELAFGGATDPLLTDDPITITYWRGCEGEGCTLEGEKAAAYEEMFPWVTISWEEVAMFDAFDQMSVALPAGEAVPTMGIQFQSWHPIFVSQGLFAPVMPTCTQYGTMEGVVDAYLPNALSAATFDGDVYTLPMQQNSYSLFINNRLFEEAGLDPVADAPTTWEELIALQDVLYKEENGQVTQKGFEFRHTAGPHWMAQVFTGMLYQAGGAPFDEEDNPTFNSPEGARVLETWADISVAPEISNNVQTSPYQDFADELDVMSFGGPNALEFVYQLNPELEGNVTVTHLPTFEDGENTFMSYGFNMWVNANATEAEQCRAWNYIDFLLDEPNDFFEAIGMVQPKKEFAESPAAQEFEGLDIALEDIENSTPLPVTEYWSPFQTAMADAVQRVVFEDQDPAEALEQAESQFLESIGG